MTLSQEVVKRLLDYDPETGVFTWRERGEDQFSSTRAWKIFCSKHAGKRAGCISEQNRNGYTCRRIKVAGALAYEHRLAWLWMTGEDPEGHVDHIDRDGTNNAWKNLRKVTPAENSRNISMRIDNSSGVTGVHWHRAARRWEAYVTREGKKEHLGMFEEIDEAAMAVLEFRADNGFHKGHGLELAHYRAAPQPRGGRER